MVQKRPSLHKTWSWLPESVDHLHPGRVAVELDLISADRGGELSQVTCNITS